MVQPDRNSAVDTIRLASLIGICVVNVPFLGLPTEVTMAPPVGLSNQIVAFLIEAFFQSKFFLLFSFLFGWGIHVQEQSAKRSSVPFTGRYYRRLLGLGLMGCLHATLVFSGDILFIYALLGLLIWPLRGLSAKALMRIGYAMMPVGLICLIVLALFVPTVPVPVTGPGLGGSFAEATLTRVADWPQTLGFLLVFQGPLAFGAFAMGLAAGKARFFLRFSEGRATLSRMVPWLLAIGTPLNLLYATSMNLILPEDQGMLALAGFVGIAVAGPMMTAVYVHLLLWLDDHMTLPTILKSAGQNSLSAYVLQGVIAGFIFGGYGLGLFNQIGPAGLLPIALVIAIAAILVVGLLAMRTGRGPLEAILRRFTYL